MLIQKNIICKWNIQIIVQSVSYSDFFLSDCKRNMHSKEYGAVFKMLLIKVSLNC